MSNSSCAKPRALRAKRRALENDGDGFFMSGLGQPQLLHVESFRATTYRIQLAQTNSAIRVIRGVARHTSLARHTVAAAHQEVMLFTTHDAHRVPLRLQEKTTIWRAIEVTCRLPWFIASVKEDGLLGDFLLGSDADVIRFVEELPPGSLGSISMVIPPGWDGNADWDVLLVREVLRSDVDGDNAVVAVSTQDGRVFGGSMLERIARAPAQARKVYRS